MNLRLWDLLTKLEGTANKADESKIPIDLFSPPGRRHHPWVTLYALHDSPDWRSAGTSTAELQGIVTSSWTPVSRRKKPSARHQPLSAERASSITELFCNFQCYLCPGLSGGFCLGCHRPLKLQREAHILDLHAFHLNKKESKL